MQLGGCINKGIKCIEQHIWKRFYSILRLGVDEAGRGAVLGPLVISCVLLDAESEHKLHEMGVKDSKQMTADQRFRLYDTILDVKLRSCSMHISSLSIDRHRLRGLSMNVIEENHIFDLLKKFVTDPVDEVVIDAFVSKNNRLHNETCKLFPAATVRCEFHADVNHTCVAAASVIAKVERDRAMSDLSKELGVDIGTGYPHDPLSTEYIRRYVRDCGKAPTIARNTWVTTQRIVEDVMNNHSVVCYDSQDLDSIELLHDKGNELNFEEERFIPVNILHRTKTT